MVQSTHPGDLHKGIYLSVCLSTSGLQLTNALGREDGAEDELDAAQRHAHQVGQRHQDLCVYVLGEKDELMAKSLTLQRQQHCLEHVRPSRRRGRRAPV